MLPLVQKDAETEFDSGTIFRQVEKIFQDPRFSGSVILKRFLEFIVREKLEGKSHLVKEYTIAVEVLHKPRNFNPQENCIVRIHAARLRKVLSDYYAGAGKGDEILIQLPKGHYVPVFSPKRTTEAEEIQGIGADVRDPGRLPAVRNSIAVFPFHCNGGDEISANLSEGLGFGLSAAFMKLKPLTVISYSLMRMMPSAFSGLGEWQHAVEARYLFTGDIQRQKNKVRVSIQLLLSSTGEMIWSHQYAGSVGTGDLFDLQDEIVCQVFQSIRKSGLLAGIRRNGVSMMAVV